MARKPARIESDPLKPSTTDAQWVAQGWAANSSELSTAPRLGATISIRLEPEAASLVSRAARLSGRTKSEFVRRATIAAAEQKVKEAEQSPLIVRSISPDRVSAVTGANQTVSRLPGNTCHRQEELVTSGADTRSTIKVG